MDEDFMNAATTGDLNFLREAASNNEYLKYIRRRILDDPTELGRNPFHLAVSEGRVRFIREAINILPKPLVHFLICQVYESTPLGSAAFEAKNTIVKDMLIFYEDWLSSSALSTTSSSSSSSGGGSRFDNVAVAAAQYGISTVKPWLVAEYLNYTAFHLIFMKCDEQSGLKLLAVDPELLTRMDYYLPSQWGERSSPFVYALQRGFNRVIFKLFNSAPDSIWVTFNKKVLAIGLHEAPNCSDEVFRLVLEKNVQLIKDDQDAGDMYSKLLTSWIKLGKFFPFLYVLKSNDHRVSHLKRLLIDQMASDEHPLHYYSLANIRDDDTALQIVEILVHAYKQENGEQSGSAKVVPPWLRMNEYGRTPLYYAVTQRCQKLALYLLSLDEAELLLKEDDQILFEAIEHNCADVAQRILNLVNEHDLITLLTSDCNRTVLHEAPKCRGQSLLIGLIDKYPELMGEEDERKVTMLHSWIKLGELWPFEYLLQEVYNTEVVQANLSTDTLICLIKRHDDQGRSPLHYAAEHKDEGFAVEAVKLLFANFPPSDVYKKWTLRHHLLGDEDHQGFTPMVRALSERHEKIATCFTSLLLEAGLLGECGGVLFKAVEFNCNQVLGFVFDWIRQHELIQTSVMNDVLSQSGQNLLHVAHKCTEQNSIFMLENFPELMNEKDRDEKTPLARASEVGATWLVELMLEKHRTCILEAKTAWVSACEKSHFSTVLAFIDKSPYLRYICRDIKDSPLHHIKGLNYSEYQELLQRPLMKELKNSQNSDGKTPLHIAIANRDKDLAEVLLDMRDVDRSIADKDGTTPMDLLQEVCRQCDEWTRMCEIIKVDPESKISYIRPDTDLAEMRNIIALVAALLATITFTAAFTLPGGLNGDSGEAILAKKAAFLAFLITNAYAMCSSMLILFCVIWSMVCDRSMSEKLIDRSLVLLKQSLYGTLLAFMTGVYTVIHQKSLWAAIAVFVMCALVVILASRTVIHELVPRMHTAGKEYKPLQFLHFRNRRKQEAIAPDSQSEHQEKTPLNNQNESKFDSMV